jgi:hypothetical protein
LICKNKTKINIYFKLDKINTILFVHLEKTASKYHSFCPLHLFSLYLSSIVFFSIASFDLILNTVFSIINNSFRQFTEGALESLLLYYSFFFLNFFLVQYYRKSQLK